MSQRDVLKAMRLGMAASVLERVPAAFQKKWNRTALSLASKTGYMPHQGERECARRLRQLERGFIKQ